MAFLVILLAALSRLVPHALHGVGLNFTAVGGALLFFGARRPRWQAPLAVAVLALTDVYLTRHVYGYPFHARDYVLTWLWYGCVCIMARGLLRTPSAVRVAAGVLASATGFFLLSNFVVWLGSAMYPHTAAGLATCYVAAVPFYANDLVSTALTAMLLFGLPSAAAELLALWRRAADRQHPLA